MRLLSRPGSRKSDSRRRPATARLRLQALEDRSLPSFGFGSAFSFGGAGTDRGQAIVLDAAGSMYVSGFYNSTVDFDPNGTNPTSNHVLTAAPSGNDPGDGFVAKYSAGGTFQWATDLGSGNALELAVQGSNVYVPYYSYNSAGYVSRLDAATGAVTWTTAITGSGGHAEAVAVNPSGILYADALSGGSASQAIVDRLDPATGNVLWTRTSSGGQAVAIRLAVDNAGNAYATGYLVGTTTFGSTSLTNPYSPGVDAYVWKLNASGGSVWAGEMGGFGTDPWGITTDGSGNVYVTGQWRGGVNNFNPGSGRAVSLPYYGGLDDDFIVKLTPGKNGAMQLGWAKDIGGTGTDGGFAVAVDGSGNVYSTGGFAGTVNFNPNSGTAHYLSGGGIFVSELNANGNYVSAASMAGTTDGNGNGTGYGIALDGAGNVYTTGLFGGTANFSPNGTYNLTSNGAGDVFVSVLTQTLTPGAMSPGGPAPDDSMPPVTVANGSLSPIGPAIALPATADPVVPDQIDWFAAAAARKRSTLFADWLADSAVNS